MRRNALLLLAILILGALIACEARAQTPAPQKDATANSIPGVYPKAPTFTTPVPQPNAEQKAKLAELAKAWDAAARAAESARKDYILQLMTTLAELGLKPSETSVTWNEKGEPVFNRVELPPTTAKTPEVKPEAKP